MHEIMYIPLAIVCILLAIVYILLAMVYILLDILYISLAIVYFRWLLCTYIFKITYCVYRNHLRGVRVIF